MLLFLSGKDTLVLLVSKQRNTCGFITLKNKLNEA